jgi:hypothetical protein
VLELLSVWKIGCLFGIGCVGSVDGYRCLNAWMFGYRFVVGSIVHVLTPYMSPPPCSLLVLCSLFSVLCAVTWKGECYSCPVLYIVFYQ